MKTKILLRHAARRNGALLSKLVFFLSLIFLNGPGYAQSNQAPAFRGPFTTLDVCQNSSTTTLNVLLTVSDADIGQTLTWSVISPPKRAGTANGFPATASTTGGNVKPSGLSFSSNGTSFSDEMIVQVSDGQATAQITVLIHVNALPTATISGGTFCRTGTTQLNVTSGQTGGFFTSTSGLNIDEDGLIDLATSTPGTYTVTYWFSDGNRCSNQTTSTVTVTTFPTATISGTTAVCQNAAQPDITFTGSGGTAPYTFTYSLNTTTGLTVSGNPSATVPVPTGTAGTYTYTLTDVSSPACSQTITEQTATVTVDPVPTATISGGTFCRTGTTQLNVTSGQAGGSFSSAAGLTINSSGFINLATSIADTYIVTYTFTGANTCTNTTTSSVTVNALPTATISGGTFCRIGTTQLNVTSGQTGGTFTSAEGLSINSSGLINLATSTPDTYTVTYSFTDANNCSNITTSPVTVNALPTATISGGTFCRTGTTQLNVTSGQTGGSFTSAAGLNISSSGLINLATSIPDTYTVTYSFTDANNCSNTTTSSVTVNALPTATISGGTFCRTGTTQLNVTSGQTGGTFSSTTGLNISSSGLINLATSTAGTYTVTYSFTDGNNCSNTTPSTVTVNALPTITLGSNPAVCKSTTSAPLTYSATTNTPTKYSINFDAIAEGQGFLDVTDANLPSGPISIIVPGSAIQATYNATLTVKNANGCTSSAANISVTVNNCTGKIYATSTTCNSFLCNQAGLDKVCYTATKKGNKQTVSNATPGVFFYYAKITAPAAGNFTVDVVQYNTSPGGSFKNFAIHQSQVFAFNANCMKIATGAETPNGSGQARITITGATAGQVFVISVKYDTKTIIGSTFTGTVGPSYQAYFISKVNGVVKNSTAGNIAVSTCSGLAAATTARVSNAEINEDTWLKADVFPNPSENEFTLRLNGNNSEPVEIRVVDMYGRSVHQVRGSANQFYKFGQHFIAGAYIIEILQGKNIKTVKIIKN